MRTDDDITAFLEARTLLPDPSGCNKTFFLVSVGKCVPAIKVDGHLASPGPCVTFLFKKCACYGRGNPYQWVCSDEKLQQLIYENHLYASIILLQIGEQ